jgi:hypothetical protein
LETSAKKSKNVEQAFFEITKEIAANLSSIKKISSSNNSLTRLQNRTDINKNNQKNCICSL